VHTKEGIAQLEKFLVPGAKIGMESTGNYSKAIYAYLKSQGYTVIYVDSRRMYNFARFHFPKVKNDKIDAELIANYTLGSRILLLQVMNRYIWLLIENVKTGFKGSINSARKIKSLAENSTVKQTKEEFINNLKKEDKVLISALKNGIILYGYGNLVEAIKDVTSR